jgi:hypothetical protein
VYIETAAGLTDVLYAATRLLGESVVASSAREKTYTDGSAKTGTGGSAKTDTGGASKTLTAASAASRAAGELPHGY